VINRGRRGQSRGTRPRVWTNNTLSDNRAAFVWPGKCSVVVRCCGCCSQPTTAAARWLCLLIRKAKIASFDRRRFLKSEGGQAPSFLFSFLPSFPPHSSSTPRLFFLYAALFTRFSTRNCNTPTSATCLPRLPQVNDTLSAVMVPTLKRETTRALCDVYTTLFDQETLLKASQSQTLSFGDETALPSPATTAYTPGSTPCSDFDDFSLDLDEVLSPPPSPWLPTVLDGDIAVPADDSTAVSERSKVAPESSVNYMSLSNIMNNFGNNNSSTGFECTSLPKQRKSQISYGADGNMFTTLDFQQVHAQQQQQTQSFSPHRQNTALVALAVRTAARSKTQGTEFTETAAPSDLFNVSMDEILSSDPLKITSETQQMLGDHDFEMLDEAATSETSQVLETDILAMIVSDNDSSSSLSSVGSSSSQETIQDDDGDFVLSCESNDLSDMEFEDESVPAAPVKRTTRRLSKGRSRPAKKSTTLKTPKVYPKRKPRESGSLDERVSKVSSPSEDSLAMPDDGYRCELCPRERFGRIHDLKRHQVSKHNDMNWPCDFCRRPFVRRDALLRHYSVKSQRKDGIHPTADEKNRLSEARARAKLVA